MTEGRLFGALSIAAYAANSGQQTVSPETQLQLRAAAFSRAIESVPLAQRCTAVQVSAAALADPSQVGSLVANLAKDVGELTPSERRLAGALASEIEASLVSQTPEQAMKTLADWRAALDLAVSDFDLRCGA